MKTRQPWKRLGVGLVAGVAVLALAACTSNEPSDSEGDDTGGGTSAAPAGSNDEPGKKVVVARRSGDVWYVAGLNGRAAAAEFNLDLSDLGERRSLVAITDAEGGKLAVVEAPKAPTTWRHEVPARGGFVLVLKRIDVQ